MPEVTIPAPAHSLAAGHAMPERTQQRFAALVVAAAFREFADDLDAWVVPDSVLPDGRTLAVVVARLRAHADEIEAS